MEWKIVMERDREKEKKKIRKKEKAGKKEKGNYSAFALRELEGVAFYKLLFVMIII